MTYELIAIIVSVIFGIISTYTSWKGLKQNKSNDKIKIEKSFNNIIHNSNNVDIKQNFQIYNNNNNKYIEKQQTENNFGYICIAPFFLFFILSIYFFNKNILIQYNAYLIINIILSVFYLIKLFLFRKNINTIIISNILLEVFCIFSCIFFLFFKINTYNNLIGLIFNIYKFVNIKFIFKTFSMILILILIFKDKR